MCNALSVAISGIAALLLDGFQIARSRFNIPIHLDAGFLLWVKASVKHLARSRIPVLRLYTAAWET